MLRSEPSEPKTRILCYYSNPTQNMEVIRIRNIPKFHFEKVVFPDESLMFEAFPEAILEIHTKLMDGCILLTQIKCDLLSVEEGGSPLKSDVAEAVIGCSQFDNPMDNG